MRQFILLALCFIAYASLAQHERDNWIIGTRMTARFQNDSFVTTHLTAEKLYAAHGFSTYSNRTTGELLLVTDGIKVYNKFYDQMPNGFDLNKDIGSSHSAIVPNPAYNNIYYVISSTDRKGEMYFATVNLDKDSGLGDVVQKQQLIIDSVDMEFCVVKQLYDQGYWLITHKLTSNEFYAYRIGINGLDTIPVISIAGNISTEAFVSGKIVSNGVGTKFIYVKPDYNNTNTICDEFMFDKNCGAISFYRSIVDPEISDFASAAYSPNDSLLYVYRFLNKIDLAWIRQYDLMAPDPNNAYQTIAVINYPVNSSHGFTEDMLLGPDGQLYITDLFFKGFKRIRYPNKMGVACSYESVNLYGSGFLGLTHFPEFIMDHSKQLGPATQIKSTCKEPVVSFSLLGTALRCDSFNWDFGDGTTSADKAVQHRYRSFGNYISSFNWYSCSLKYTITDTVQIYPDISISFGTDTAVCKGNAVVLSGPHFADEYRWSTGDSGSSIVVKTAGNYSLNVKKGNCETESAIRVDLVDPFLPTLREEYYICDNRNELVKLDAGKDFTQYKWTPTGDTTQWIIVGDVGKYFVVVKDYRGCDGSAGTKVERRCPVSVFYPNAFTPNNDGVNDLFLPIGSDVVKFKLTIYNAWGQRVFESTQIEKGWDGKVEGKPAPIGTYLYQSTYSGYRNKRLVEFETNGNVTLIR
jgi:gliding motility-associated-like protein